MEDCDACKQINTSFINGQCKLQCFNCIKTNKSILLTRENEILLNPNFCKCHNFEKINTIVSRICMIEVTIASLLSELGKLKTMISQCEV